LQARFSYSTAIGRPTFGQITASTIVNSVDRTITTGNPGLRPTTDNSFDLALDYYPVKSSYFSIGLFDKQIANYIFQRSVIVPLDGTFYTESTFRSECMRAHQTAPSSANITARPTRLECSGNIFEGEGTAGATVSRQMVGRGSCTT
jgi:outer membrane receptor protein involved in Fe transport